MSDATVSSAALIVVSSSILYVVTKNVPSLVYSAVTSLKTLILGEKVPTLCREIKHHLSKSPTRHKRGDY